MKRLLPILLACLLLPVLAVAAPAAQFIDTQPLSLEAEVLDSPDDEAAYGPFILRLQAPSGQELHLLSWLKSPRVYSQDVNFDGQEDLAVVVSSGASNEVYRLFLNLEGRYVPVNDGTEEGLFNLALYPQAGLIGSHGSSGYAGALHEDLIFRWQGSRLLPVRKAVCQLKSDTVFNEESYTVTTWSQVLLARVYDLSGGRAAEPLLLFEESYDMQAQGMGEDYLAYYQREQQALWQGLGD